MNSFRTRGHKYSSRLLGRTWQTINHSQFGRLTVRGAAEVAGEGVVEGVVVGGNGVRGAREWRLIDIGEFSHIYMPKCPLSIFTKYAECFELHNVLACLVRFVYGQARDLRSQVVEKSRM